MAKMNLYLAFDNALEAFNYYQQHYQATIANHQTLTLDIAKELQLDEQKIANLAKSTYYAEMTIYGVTFYLSDRFNSTEQFNDTFNIVLAFNLETDKPVYEQLLKNVKNDSEARLIFEQVDYSKENSMFRFTDKYNITWAVVI